MIKLIKEIKDYIIDFFGFDNKGWKIIIDFTEIKNGGIEIGELLNKL